MNQKFSGSNLIVSVVLGLAVLGCSPRHSDTDGPDGHVANRADTRAGLGAKGSAIGTADAKLISSFLGLPNRWNQSAAPLVRDYLDPNVPAERWVSQASEPLGELRAVYTEMLACATAIGDPGVRKTLQDLTSNYRDKLDGLTRLHRAVAAGDEKGEKDAQRSISEASVEGQKLAGTMLERIRPHVDPNIFAEELTKQSREIGDLLRAPR